MIVIIGKTASGKDLLLNKMVERGYERVVTYTTRPMRKSEKKDVTYHYVSEEEFKQKIESGFFAEYKSYKTAYGTWYYGSAAIDYASSIDNKNKVIILTPDGYRDILKLEKCIDIDIIPIYIYANNSTINERLAKRGDKKEEAERRMKCDNADFKDFQYEVKKTFYNNDGQDIYELVNKVIRYVEG